MFDRILYSCVNRLKLGRSEMGRVSQTISGSGQLGVTSLSMVYNTRSMSFHTDLNSPYSLCFHCQDRLRAPARRLLRLRGTAVSVWAPVVRLQKTSRQSERPRPYIKMREMREWFHASPFTSAGLRLGNELIPALAAGCSLARQEHCDPSPQVGCISDRLCHWPLKRWYNLYLCICAAPVATPFARHPVEGSPSRSLLCLQLTRLSSSFCDAK